MNDLEDGISRDW